LAERAAVQREFDRCSLDEWLDRRPCRRLVSTTRRPELPSPLSETNSNSVSGLLNRKDSASAQFRRIT